MYMKVKSKLPKVVEDLGTLNGIFQSLDHREGNLDLEVQLEKPVLKTQLT